MSLQTIWLPRIFWNIMIFQTVELTVSQVHRHPNGCLHFSAGDYPANIKLARQFGGVVNGLMFIDPEFRIKFTDISAERG